jgi:endonuclease/exonuclease/phosphatase family metal-dependent hydrolase
MLKIITYNIETGKNLEKIYQWIEQYRPNTDIICFQEFPEEELRNITENIFLKNYSHSFSPGLKKNGNQLGQITLFKKEKYKLIEEYIIDIGHDDLEVFYKKTPTKRSVLVTTFEIDGRQFIVANIHLSAFAFNLKRRKQTKKVIEGLIESVPLILLGDFNYSSLFGSKAFINYMENLGLVLAGEKMITNKYKGILKQQLDYVFYNGFKLNDIKVEELNYSDHFPVNAEFDFK